MNLKLIIFVDHPEVKLVLKRGRKTLDELKWTDNNQLSLMLLKNIDKIIKNNTIDLFKLDKVEVKTKQEQKSYTSFRIAKAVSQAAGCCLAGF